MQIVIHPNGAAQCIYDESIDLAALGRVSITRASHVEPNPQGGWLADLSPVNGPRLGPYRLRSEALDAEREWLLCHWLIPMS